MTGRCPRRLSGKALNASVGRRTRAEDVAGVAGHELTGSEWAAIRVLLPLRSGWRTWADHRTAVEGTGVDGHAPKEAKMQNLGNPLRPATRHPSSLYFPDLAIEVPGYSRSPAFGEDRSGGLGPAVRFVSDQSTGPVRRRSR